MKLAVVGAGAMGGAFATEASAAGHEVYLLDVSAELVAAIRDRGITVRGGDRDLVERVPAYTDAAQIGPVEAVVVFVKAQHTRAAARSLGPLLGERTVVASLQNGWGNSEVIAEEIGAQPLVFGVTYNSCSVTAPAEIAHTGRGETLVGPYKGDDREPAARVAKLLTSAGWAGSVVDDVRTEIWKKLILNAATLPTAALTGLPAGELGGLKAMHALIDTVAAEACTVAKGLGLAIDAGERIERIHAVLAAAGRGKASMLQDAEARRKTEVEVINDAVVRTADELGIDVPINRALTALVHGLERSWSL